MKNILNYKSFKQSINEAFSFGSYSVNSEANLNKAADIILQFLNRKTSKTFKKYPFITHSKGIPGVMLYSMKDNSAVRIGGNTSKGIGIVGELAYFSDAASEVADFVLTSDNFSVVSLLTDFSEMINNPKYIKQIQESYITEGAVTLSPDLKKQIQNKLDAGESAMSIAKEFKLSYGVILKVRNGVNIPEDASPIVQKNTQTLNDKVKYLNETLEDIYEIARRIAAGAFNSLFISGRAGTGKTFSVEKALKDEGLQAEQDYTIMSGAVSVIEMYRKLFQYNDKVLVFDDCDAVFRDENGRNILKAALDTKKVRKISYLKKIKDIYDPLMYENDPDGELDAIERGEIPAYFNFTGRVVFISNLPKDKADPDGAIRSRSILIDVSPDDATLMERMRVLLPQLEPMELPLKDKEEIFEFMKSSKNVSMRTFVKAAGFKLAGLPNWKRMAERYV
jgi:hypothetical protein